MVIPSEYTSALQPSIIADSSSWSSISIFNFLISGAMKKGDPVCVTSSLSESVEGSIYDSPKSNNLIELFSVIIILCGFISKWHILIFFNSMNASITDFSIYSN